MDDKITTVPFPSLTLYDSTKLPELRHISNFVTFKTVLSLCAILCIVLLCSTHFVKDFDPRYEQCTIKNRPYCIFYTSPCESIVLLLKLAVSYNAARWNTATLFLGLCSSMLIGFYPPFTHDRYTDQSSSTLLSKVNTS